MNNNINNKQNSVAIVENSPIKKKKRTLMEMAQALKIKAKPITLTNQKSSDIKIKEEGKVTTQFTRKRKQRKLYSRTPIQIPEKYTIEYKRLGLLRHFLTKYGKIRPRRVSRIPLKQQRRVAKSIRRARATGLIPCNIQAKNS
jgi:ribosomal protein S18